MKAITRTLLALFVVSASFAFAADGVLDEILEAPAIQVEEVQEVETQEEITVQDLENMDSDMVEVYGCCLVECWEERQACNEDCTPGDQVCYQHCTNDFNSCKGSC